MSWISVCGIDDVSEDEPKAVEVNDKKLVYSLSMSSTLQSKMCVHMRLRCSQKALLKIKP